MDDQAPAKARDPAPRLSLGRLLPLVALAVALGVIVAMGWHRHLSFESLVRHHGALQGFVAQNTAAALAAYIGLYIAVVALSVPGAVYLTIAGGILFGVLLGGVAAVTGATIGAICVFLIARSALGEQLARRAGPLAARLAEGFRADAFSYLLFLRLVPVFPFWLVNLVPALAGVRLSTFAAATAIGIVPGGFAFAFVGSGLTSVITAQEKAYRACLDAGRADCRLDFDLKAAVTPELLMALAALGVVALIPVVVKRLRARRRGATQ